MRSVATDTSSRTSVALLRVLFERRFGAGPLLVPEPPHPQAMLARHDAALVIGDPALAIDPARFRHAHCYDLAEEWQAMTGLPFVFAFWAVRGDACSAARAARRVRASSNAPATTGATASTALCEEEAGYLGLSRAEPSTAISRYHIDYSLDEDNIDGLRLFFRYAQECGALPPRRR